MTRAASIAGTTLLGGLALAILALSLGLVAARVAGYSSLIVTGRSMEPTIPVGAIVLVRPIAPDDVRIGDVVTMRGSAGLITHRVIGIERGRAGREFTLQGDANPVPDVERIAFVDRAGLVVAAVPHVGVVVAHSRAYWRAAVIASGALLMVGGLILLVRARRHQAAGAASPRGAPLVRAA